MAEYLTTEEKIEKTVQDEMKKAKSAEERKTTAQKFVDSATNKQDAAERVREELVNTDKVSQENKSTAEDLNIIILRMLTEEVLNEETTISPAAKAVLGSLRTQGMSAKLRLHLAPIIIKMASKPDYLQLVDQPESEFNKDLKDLLVYYPLAANPLKHALLTAAAEQKLSMSQEELKDLLEKVETESDVKREELKQKYEEQMNRHSRRESRVEYEKNYLLETFQDASKARERELVIAIYGDPSSFWEYMKGLYDGEGFEHPPEGGLKGTDQKYSCRDRAEILVKKIIDTKYTQKNLPPPSDTEIDKLVKQKTDELASKEFENRVRKLIGQLYQRMDTENPRELSRNILQQGNVYVNLQSVTTSFLNRLGVIKEYTIPEEIKNKHSFYRAKRDIIRIDSQVTSQEAVSFDNIYVEVKNNKAVDTQSTEYLHPTLKLAKTESFNEFMGFVHKSVQTEINLRLFLHDARALPYRDTGDRSFWEELAGFARQHLNTEDIDNIHTLYGADEIMTASRIWDKLQELAFAHSNWVYRNLADYQDPSTKETVIDEATRKYISILYQTMPKWEVDRILATGIGDNYGVTLRAHTTASQTDAPRDLPGKQTNQSYGASDSKIYGVFNLDHTNLRWSSETAQMAGLVDLFVEGDDIEEFAKNWDWRDIHQSSIDARNAYTTGRSPIDVINNRVRFGEIKNMGRVGGIYDRAGWRAYYAYEGWFKNGDVLGTWKAMEHIGIEIMKNFAFNDIAGVDGSFYGKGDESISKRKEFVSYLYRKYFVNPENVYTESEINLQIDAIFKDLEADKPNTKRIEGGYAPKKALTANYADFYNRVLARAIAQRLPTKFLRLESERKRYTDARRDTNYNAVFNLAKGELSRDIKPKEHWDTLISRDSRVNPEREAYYQALQDICAFGEALLREDTTKNIKKQLEFNDGLLYDVKIDNFNLTPERMEELWRKYHISFDPDPNVDLARKRNAVAVLKANRRYIFSETPLNGADRQYLDMFANSYGGGIPYEPAFAIATEDIERSLLAYTASGLNTNSRLLGEIAEVDRDVMKTIQSFYKTLRKSALSKDHNFDAIIKDISTARGALSGMHGSNVANQVVHWMSRMTIAFFKKNEAKEHPLSNFAEFQRQAGTFSSLAGFITNARQGEVWEWDRSTIRSFIEELAKLHKLPYYPYKSNKTAKEEEVYRVTADGKDFVKGAGGKLKAAKKKRRVPDFDFYTKQLEDQFLDSPMRAVLKHIPGLLGMMMIIAMVNKVINAYKQEIKQ